ncbi:Hsp20/alpha crystallin family protein [Plantactinospora sp. BB1]|uniref:Hsp20/alpha crystallin family protein n=1 Tax=Plantactinospora sp. BB1 TaxID=2071627 RepID=UPI000D179035|nr:Hsp20/alpha crystallin family protein [Plantactinospora sp. BB1]AVT37708.1 heat-shock protein Hsp20 [Plantactinospora sp. BB1]
MTTTSNAPDRAVHRLSRPTHRRHRTPAPAVPVDIYRREDHDVVLCDLPGLDPGSLDVEADGTTITVRGHRSAPHLPDATPVTNQRPSGIIDQQIRLDRPATGHGITATYTDGVLTLTIPTDSRRDRHVHDQRSPAHVLHAIN